ncbi:MAG TPA: SpoIIE family protein phosphatase [Thermoanaerobaculia bacterium]|nr:SpoIIE family protein phosphatase [Thermoanaerobaculia bacterium]
MPLRKSTRVWFVVLAVAIAGSVIAERAFPGSGCWHVVLLLVIAQAVCILLWRAGTALFRLIVRRLTLRLAFSYFLIGIVPIPLLAALLGLSAYVVGNQFIASRLRREITAVGETAARTDARLPEIAVGDDGKITASKLAWLPAGSDAPWAAGLTRPGFLVEGENVWLAVRKGPGRVVLLDLSDPAAPWLVQLADATGYETSVDVGTSEQEGTNFSVDAEPREAGVSVAGKKVRPSADSGRHRPTGAPPPERGVLGDWVHGFYLETALNAVAEKARSGRNVALLMAVTSPRTVARQLFTQGVDEIAGVFRVAFLVLVGIVLAVYVVALAVAFGLVGSIARTVNRLTRATRAVSRGDFSVRVNSSSPDQIGDLARSFDTMAASIEGLLKEAADKERLESEIAIASTIQQKLLPPPEARLEGVSVLAHFAPVAEIGGDYYDYLPMPDGRLAFALGDVSGHGLPTGLLVAMAKAALSSLVEAGHSGGELFGRLNELIHRSTDPRRYMTLAVLAYDPRTRRGTLTNAGQLAPYRVSGAAVEALPLPSFPLGLSPARTFPSREETFAPGDLVVFSSDGLIEAVDATDEPFGFERFENVLRVHAAEGAAALRAAILAAVAAHSGNRPADDDRTLLIVTLDERPDGGAAIESPQPSE